MDTSPGTQEAQGLPKVGARVEHRERGLGTVTEMLVHDAESERIRRYVDDAHVQSSEIMAIDVKFDSGEVRQYRCSHARVHGCVLARVFACVVCTCACKPVLYTAKSLRRS